MERGHGGPEGYGRRSFAAAFDDHKRSGPSMGLHERPSRRETDGEEDRNAPDAGARAIRHAPGGPNALSIRPVAHGASRVRDARGAACAERSTESG